MIYDPRRAAQELRERIIESMTPEELEAYARELEARAEAMERETDTNEKSAAYPSTADSSQRALDPLWVISPRCVSRSLR